MIKAGTWVSITSTILTADQRAEGIPADTAATPLVMWVKGFLAEDCEIGSKAKVRTVTGRVEVGVLEETNPTVQVDYGGFVPEVLQIGADARAILFGGGK